MLRKLFLPIAVVALLAGCGPASTTSTSTTSTSAPVSGTTAIPLSGTAAISIANMAYSPATMVVKVGTVITVTNNDFTQHSLTADNGSFDTGILNNGKSATVTMNTAGTFTYHCQIHGTAMTGTITVVN